MFSLILQPGQTHTVEISTALTITNIAFGETIIGQDRSLVKIKYLPDEDDDELDIVGEDKASEGQEAVIAALVPGQAEQFSLSVTLDRSMDYVEMSCTGPNEVHIVGHYLPADDDEELDGPLDGSDSDAESDSDWDLDEDELGNLGEDDLKLTPSLQAIADQNDAFNLAQARKLLAEQELLKTKAVVADERDEVVYANYKYTPQVASAGEPFASLTLDEDEDEDDEDGDYDEDMQVDDSEDEEMSASEDEHEADIADMQKQAKGELAGIQQLMLSRRIEAAKKLVAEADGAML